MGSKKGYSRMGCDINPFQRAIAEQTTRLRELAGQGKRFIGHFCTYAPVELIHATGFVPIRISGRSRTVQDADSLVPVFICPFLRQAMEAGMSGDYDFLSGIVQGYTCDAACGVIDIWQENIGGEIFHTVPLPYNDNPEARTFLTAGYRELAGKLEQSGGRMTDESLTASLDLYANIRQRVLDLYKQRSSDGFPLNASDFLTVIQAGFCMPPEEYLPLLDTLMDELNTAPRKNFAGVPLLVSGSLVESTDVLTTLDSLGARVVADDLCTGYRHFDPVDGSGESAMDRLVDRYIKRAPCASRARAEIRAAFLDRLVDESGARAVVFMFQKFCTPHLGDYPFLKKHLDGRGIRSLMVELEETDDAGGGRLATRLEGFLEILNQ
jgi:benzoyl-CoA reductase/2-hydroxyglutaryl-CoA dehydratase subunit BcrC/BadD/HgdB